MKVLRKRKLFFKKISINFPYFKKETILKQKRNYLEIFLLKKLWVLFIILCILVIFLKKFGFHILNFSFQVPTEYPLFSDSPIILLGQSFQYTPKKNYIQDQFSNDKQFVSNESSNNPLFSFPGMLEAFYSLIWFSYRKDYPPLEPSHFTTDIGWGCMLRTGQMLVAKALSVHLCGYGKIEIFFFVLFFFSDLLTFKIYKRLENK